MKVIEKGIYKDITFEDVYVIILKQTNDYIYGVDCNSIDAISNQEIQDQIYENINDKNLQIFWKMNVNKNISYIDNYLGKIYNKLYDRLCKELYKRKIWKRDS